MPVKPLLFVQTRKEDEISDEDFMITSGSEDENNDEPWFPNQFEAKKCKDQEDKASAKKEKFKPGFFHLLYDFNGAQTVLYMIGQF